MRTPLFFNEPEALRQWAKWEKDLDPEAKEMVSFWMDNPAIWCYFTILEIGERDFFPSAIVLRERA